MNCRFSLPGAVAASLLLGSAAPGVAQDAARPRDAASIRACAEKYNQNVDEGERRCIFTIVADPCTKRKAQAAHGAAECFRAEQAIWDDLLNDNFRKLREDLDEDQK